MARFDVCKFSSSSVTLVLNVQADLLGDLKTRTVIPLIPLAKAQKEVLPRLKPILQVKGKEYVLMTTDIGTVRKQDLGAVVTNIDDQRYEIIAAIDFLFQGF